MVTINKRKCHVVADTRGKLVQVLSDKFLAEMNLTFGQIYFISFEGAGVVRGNHYHLKQTETFLVLHGIIKLELRHIETGEIYTEVISAHQDLFFTYTFGPKILHTMTSFSPYALLLAHSHFVYAQHSNDTSFL